MRKLVDLSLEDPVAYEGRVRARLAEIKERKRKYGHWKADYHLVVALRTNFTPF